MMKYCSNCGGEFNEGSKFCGQCGQQSENLNKRDEAQAEKIPIEIYEKTENPVLSKSNIMKKIIAIAFTLSTFTIALVSFYFAIKGPETNTFNCNGELMTDSYATVLDEANTIFFLPLNSIMFFMSLYLLVISFKETK